MFLKFLLETKIQKMHNSPTEKGNEIKATCGTPFW